jgi:hypothetical protein
MTANTTGTTNVAIGRESLRLNTTGSENVSVGNSSLFNNTSGQLNVAIGASCLVANTTGISNTAIGYGCASGNFNGSVILGRDATATASNQFVVGSAGTNAGAITTEAVISDRTWSVRINGTAYKILLKA